MNLSAIWQNTGKADAASFTEIQLFDFAHVLHHGDECTEDLIITHGGTPHISRPTTKDSRTIAPMMMGVNF